jgi:hypothetical protein
VSLMSMACITQLEVLCISMLSAAGARGMCPFHIVGLQGKFHFSPCPGQPGRQIWAQSLPSSQQRLAACCARHVCCARHALLQHHRQRAGVRC